MPTFLNQSAKIQCSNSFSLNSWCPVARLCSVLSLFLCTAQIGFGQKLPFREMGSKEREALMMEQQTLTEMASEKLLSMDSEKPTLSAPFLDSRISKEPRHGSASLHWSSFSSNPSDISSSMSDNASFQSLWSSPSLRFPQVFWHPDLQKSVSAKKVGGSIGSSCLVMLGGDKTDGAVLVLGSSDGIQSWKASSFPDRESRFGSQFGSVKAMTSVVGQSVTLVTAHGDHSIRLWKVPENFGGSLSSAKTLKLVSTLPSMKDCLKNMLKPKGYVKVRRHKRCLWIKHIDVISSIASTRDGRTLYSASWDRTVKVWRLPQGKCVESFRAHDDAINSIVVSRDGFLYTASADSTIKAWKRSDKTGNHSLVGTMQKHKSAVNSLALSSDGHFLFSGGCDTAIVMWERKGKGRGSDDEAVLDAVGVLKGHTRAVLCLSVIDQRLLCSGSADKTLRIWSREMGDCLAVLLGHRSPIKSIISSMDELAGYVVYSGSLDGEVRTWLPCAITKRENSGDLVEK